MDPTEKALVPGRATSEGTGRYARRHGLRTGPTITPALVLPSLGLGTGGYGAPGDPTPPLALTGAVTAAFEGGLNHVDCAITYGAGLAEQVVGSALSEGIERGAWGRDEIVVVTKGGYLHLDPASFERAFLRPGLCGPDDVTRGHCLAPAFLRAQVDQSRSNLRLETLDVYLLHNPEEQLVARGPAVFRRQVCLAFAAMEELLAAGAIGAYGVAAAEGFVTAGAGFHPVDLFFDCAREVAGDGHRFRYVELPCGLVRRHAFTARNHEAPGGGHRTVLEACEAAGLTVLGSAPLDGARTRIPIPDLLRSLCPSLDSDVGVALQFARSIPAVTTSLVGMRSAAHVAAALRLASLPPLDLLAAAG